MRIINRRCNFVDIGNEIVTLHLISTELDLKTNFCKIAIRECKPTSGYMTFGGVHIRMGDGGKESFQDASQDCNVNGGYLPKITSPEDLSALINLMGTNFGYKTFRAVVPSALKVPQFMVNFYHTNPLK